MKHTIDDVGTSTKNLQENRVCERIHLTVADILRVIMRTTKTESGNRVAQVINKALVTAQRALNFW